MNFYDLKSLFIVRIRVFSPTHDSSLKIYLIFRHDMFKILILPYYHYNLFHHFGEKNIRDWEIGFIEQISLFDDMLCLILYNVLGWFE